MVEVMRVLGNLQLDTEGGLVPACGTEGLVIPSTRRSKPVKDGAKLLKDDPASVGATKDGRKMAVARNKAVGCFTEEIGVTKADAGNKEAVSFTGEIGVTKAKLGNKDAAGNFTSEIDLIKAEVGATGKGVVTEEAWIAFVFPRPPPEWTERKAEPTPTTGAMITKEMVPGYVVDRLKEKRPFLKLPPIDNPNSELFTDFPDLLESYVSNMVRWNYLIDLQADVVKQHAEKGFAEVGVDFTGGVKKIFILPQEQGWCAP